MKSLSSSLPRLLVLLSIPSAIAVAASSGCVASVEFEPLPTDPIEPTTPKGVGGGALYGLSNSAVVKVDPVTGVTTPVASFPAGIGVSPGAATAALDLAHRRYSFAVPDSATGSRLVSVDIDSGAIVADVLLDRAVRDLGVDGSTGNLICKSFPPGSDLSTMEISSLDPITGALTKLSTYPTPSSGAGMGSCVYSGDGTYFTLEFPNYESALVVLDAATGASVLHPLSGPSVFDLQYDDATDKVVALSFDGDWSTGGADEVDVRLVTVDPSTGAVSSKAHIPGVDHVMQGSTAYDPTTKRYFFAGGPSVPQGVSYWVEGNDIFTIDAETGAVLGHPEITAGPVYNMHYAP